MPVQQLHACRGEHHVRGFDVAMHHAGPMRRVERAPDCDGALQRLIDRQRPALQAFCQRLPVDELHHEIVDGAFSADVEERADVRMTQLRHDTRFAFEAAPAIGIARQVFAQRLDRDDAFQPRVAGAVHLAHTATAEQRKNFVSAKASAGRKCHWQECLEYRRSLRQRGI